MKPYIKLIISIVLQVISHILFSVYFFIIFACGLTVDWDVPSLYLGAIPCFLFMIVGVILAFKEKKEKKHLNSLVYIPLVLFLLFDICLTTLSLCCTGGLMTPYDMFFIIATVIDLVTLTYIFGTNTRVEQHSQC